MRQSIAFKGSRVLVISAHPDDAEIVMGGTIACLIDGGALVTVLNVTVSETSERKAALRTEAASRAAAILGYKLKWFAEGQYHQVEDILEYDLVRAIDAEIEAVRPDLVFSHWVGDSHADHARLARAVLASSRRWKSALLAFPPSEHRTAAFASFCPNVYIDIERNWKKKCTAIAQFSYEGQSFRALDESSIAAIGRAWGAACGSPIAEAFQLIRATSLPVSSPHFDSS